MNRERAPENASTIPRRSALVFGGLLLILFIAGSAADYSLANALFTPENALGTVLAAYGEAPALLALVAAGTLAVTARPPVHLVLRWQIGRASCRERVAGGEVAVPGRRSSGGADAQRA